MSGADRAVERRRRAKQLTEGELTLRDLIDLVLEDQPGTERFLLVVDQWEELYTQCEEDTRRKFIDETRHQPSRRARFAWF